MRNIKPLVLFTVLSSSIQANESLNNNIEPIENSGWLLALGQVSLDAQKAAAEGIKNSATYVKLGWETQNDSLLFGLGISGYLYSDYARFSQKVESNFGNKSTEKSSAESVNFYLEGGYNFNLTEHIDLQALIGMEVVIQSERGIANCSDCYSSDINIDGGLYINPRIRFNTSEALNFYVGYHSYMSGDVNSALSLALSYTY